MTQLELLLAEIPFEKIDLLTREELVMLLKGEQSIRKQLQEENTRLRALNNELKQKSLFVEEQLITIKNKLFGKSSERPANEVLSNNSSNKSKKKKLQLPSERYPNAALIERHVTLDQMPSCGCCGSEMEDSGMTEDSEYLTVVPKQFIVVREMRHKYRCCKCHGDIKTTPVLPRIKSGSAYSDEMMIDVSMSKYCDLIPIERYSRMAEREGLQGLPSQSLIETSHYLADYVKEAYRKLKTEICASQVLHADETPHRMLEGDKKCHWYLWGFSTPETAYFECHDTRSGDVASSLLSESKCDYLVSDVFSGYNKAVNDTNVFREAQGLPIIESIYCNAHAQRKFTEARDIIEVLISKAKTEEERVGLESEYDKVDFYVKEYKEIYRLWHEAKGRPPDETLKSREEMKPHYKRMQDQAMKDLGGYSEKSAFGKAMRYFVKNHEGFTRFLKNPELPIDNNPAERLLRSPVVGRKTWYGNHSKLGARTSAILFSLAESCKLNKVNPREYLKALVADLHQGKTAFTPSEYKQALESQSSDQTE